MQVSEVLQQSTVRHDAPVSAQVAGTLWHRPTMQSNPPQQGTPFPHGTSAPTHCGTVQTSLTQESRSQQRTLAEHGAPTELHPEGSAMHAPMSSMQIEPSGHSPQDPPQPSSPHALAVQSGSQAEARRGTAGNRDTAMAAASERRERRTDSMRVRVSNR